MRLKTILLAAAVWSVSAQAATFTVESGASYQPAVAPNSWAVAFGTAMATAKASATLTPQGQWPTALGGITVQVDGLPAELYYVSPGQINFLVPAVTDFGSVSVVITNTNSGATQTSSVVVENTAAAIFTANASGAGPGAILNGVTYAGAPFLVETTQNGGSDLRTRLAVYCTGIRNASSVTAQGTDPAGNAYNFTVEYAGIAPGYIGLDQVNIVLPAQLDGAGAVSLSIVADNSTSNTVTFQVNSLPASQIGLVGLTLSTNEITGGNSLTGTVWLNGLARSAGFPVSLKSSLATLVLPSIVTVAQGQASAAFTIQTVSTATVQNVTLTAQTSATVISTQLQVDPTTMVQLSGFQVTPSTVQGGASLSGTVSLSGNAPLGGVPVTVSSDDPVATPPSPVTVQVNSSSATFAIPTTAVTAAHTVHFTATQGNNTVTAQASVLPAVQITLSSDSVTGGASVTATVTLGNAAPTGGAVIGMTSSATSFAQVQGSPVTIAAGQSTAQLTIVTFSVTALHTVTITATYGAVGSATATLTVNPQTVGALQSVTVSPALVTGGSSATGTITLTGPASALGLTVGLKSSNASAASTPQTVVVPAGSSTATFTITTSHVASTQTVTITATAGSVTQTATLTVL